MAGEDPEYSDWIHQQPCCFPHCGTRKGVGQHHPRGPAYGVGMGMRSHDWYSIPLCATHHRANKGIEGMPKEERRKLEFQMGVYHRKLYMIATKGHPCGEEPASEVF